jgi:hypothetical protein
MMTDEEIERLSNESVEMALHMWGDIRQLPSYQRITISMQLLAFSLRIVATPERKYESLVIKATEMLLSAPAELPFLVMESDGK